MVSEEKEIALKRLKIRSWRRGTKEMDLILGKFADENLSFLSQSDIEVYDKMLDENDNDLYNWCSKKMDAPEVYRTLLTKIMKV
ncbi:MAG: succinate dehydrogenase assembly factor 2 [Paracoccaceae bacterium]